MIPKDNELQSVILMELYCSQDFALKTDRAYSRVLEYFENISEDAINIVYHGSNSKFENSVQFAVMHLKGEGYIVHHKISGFGVWKLSERGIAEARRHYVETYGYDPHISITDVIISDVEQVENENDFSEGKKKYRLSSFFERKAKIRAETVKFHGLKCAVCSFDFVETYGELGKDFIEVHHIIPISSFDGERNVNPQTDMTVLCANCHRMMHRSKDRVLTVEELSEIIAKNRK